VRSRRLWILICLALASVGLSACGKEAHPTVADADNNGFYVDAGNMTYQLQISRELNPYSVEDSQYLKGLPAGTPQAKPNQIWYGVFLLAKNQTDQPLRVTDRFDIVDTQGNVYTPITVDPALNPYAWRPVDLLPSGTEPALNTTMSQGPTQGGLVLFKLSDTVYNNRPITLRIHPPSGESASISLNL
jgi:hypothetical protein